MTNWKHEYLDLADTITMFVDKHPPLGRVTDLLHGYAAVVRALLYAEVNGGLDEIYDDFPDAPKLAGYSDEIETEPDSPAETSGPT